MGGGYCDGELYIIFWWEGRTKLHRDGELYIKITIIIVKVLFNWLKN